jgi:trehalose synthase
MWKARPVVASRVGGIREQIDHGATGLLVEPRDLGGFADAVAGVLEDPVAARGIGQRAREMVRDRFLGPGHLRKYVDLFEHLLSATSPTRSLGA